MDLVIPETLDDVTPEWARAALLAGGVVDPGDATIRIEPMHHSRGLIGDLAIVHLERDASGDGRRFALKVPAKNPGSRRIGTMLNAYRREAAFYREVAGPSSPVRAPICVYNAFDEDGDRWALIIEYIDADEIDAVGGATVAQANAAIDALAALHGAWWGRAAVFDWMPGFDTTGVGGLQPLWLENLPVFVERYEAVLPGDTAAWVQRFAPTLREWSEHAATGPLTLVHADYRIDNLIFHDDTVTIIDWQTAMRAPAAMDVSCFITTSLAIEQRRSLEPELIDRYLRGLEVAGVVVDRGHFLKSYDETLLWWMGQFGNNLAHLDPGDEVTSAALRSMVERVYTAGHDRGVGSSLATD